MEILTIVAIITLWIKGFHQITRNEFIFEKLGYDPEYTQKKIIDIEDAFEDALHSIGDSLTDENRDKMILKKKQLIQSAESNIKNTPVWIQKITTECSFCMSSYHSVLVILLNALSMTVFESQILLIVLIPVCVVGMQVVTNRK